MRRFFKNSLLILTALFSLKSWAGEPQAGYATVDWSVAETLIAARFYNIPSNALVGTWLKRFEKSGIKGLIPRKPSGQPPMKPKYARMPPPPKTEENRLRLRILQLEAEVAYLKELRRLRLQDEAEQRKLSKG